jgi:hypothetical protein
MTGIGQQLWCERRKNSSKSGMRTRRLAASHSAAAEQFFWYREAMRALWMSVVLGATACDRDASQCHERMASAQGIVAQVDGKSVTSVKASLRAVEEAHAACEKAKLGPEREQLLKAKNELLGQLDLLELRARRKKQVLPSPEELARLAKSGDPSCPKGQAYKPRGSANEVRCTGPQLVEMGAEDLKAYYGDRRFKINSQETPAEVRAELGSEKYVFRFDKLGDAAPRCVTAFAAPGLSWQEVTSRLTGVPPERLKLDATVKVGARELQLEVEHVTDKPTIRLGDCATH